MKEIRELESLVARLEREFEPVRKKLGAARGRPLSVESIQTEAIYRRKRLELTNARTKLNNLRGRKR